MFEHTDLIPVRRATLANQLLRVVLRQLIDYAFPYSTVLRVQCWFRLGHSIGTAMLRVISDILSLSRRSTWTSLQLLIPLTT